MGALASLGRRIRNATYQDTSGWFADWLRGEESDSGISVNEHNAMRIPTVFKCVRWRGQQFGMLPKKIYEHVDLLGRPAQRPATGHYLYSLINARPNPLMGSMAFFEMVSADLDLWGNFWAYPETGGNTGRIQALWRFRPDMVRPKQDANGAIIWQVSDGRGNYAEFLRDELIHVPGLGFDGVMGYSPIRLMMQDMGWAKATRRHGAVFFKNAGRVSGIISTPATLKPEQKRGLIESLSKNGKDAGSVALIEGGADYKQLAMAQDEAQFIETIQFQEDDIAGMMNVKPHKIGIMRNMTNNNVEQQNIEAVTDCLQPLCVRVEEWLNLQLFSDLPSSGRGGGREFDRFFMKCELKGLLRGDTAAQTAFLKEMFNSAAFSPNKILEYLDEEPIEGGDRQYINGAMVPVDRMDEVIDKKGTTPNPNPSGTNASIDLEAVRRCAEPPFRDAIGRIIARKAGRSAVAADIIDAAFSGLVAGLCVELDPDFGSRYLAALAKRSTDWKPENKESIAAAEFNRAFDELVELGQTQEYFKERTCNA